MTLASILIEAGRAGERVRIDEVCERLQLSEEELREDVNVLNVVNFGGGSYVLYAEIKEEEGEIEVDPEPYSDNFDRPARLLPVEAKALVAAIDLIGEHIPEGSLTSAREKIVAALGEDPMEQGLQVAPTAGDDSDVARLVSKAIVERRLIELEYYKENEDELSLRRVEPYALTNGREGWYVASFDPERDGVRHFRLDRIKRVTVTEEKFAPRPEVDPAAEVDGWLRTGEVEASRAARVWVSPERARWAREARRVVEEWSDGAVIVELSFAGVDWLVREILQEAGDAAVLEPEDAREAVHAAAGRLREMNADAARASSAGRREPPRADQDERAGGRRVPRGGAHGHLRHRRPARLAAPDAAVVRPARAAGAVRGWRAAPVGVDVRGLAEGAQPRARPARDAAGRGGRALPGAARRDARVRGRRAPRPRCRRRARARDLHALRRAARRARRAASCPRRSAAMVERQAAKRVGLEFVELRRASWDHRKLGGVY